MEARSLPEHSELTPSSSSEDLSVSGHTSSTRQSRSVPALPTTTANLEGAPRGSLARFLVNLTHGLHSGTQISSSQSPSGRPKRPPSLAQPNLSGIEEASLQEPRLQKLPESKTGFGQPPIVASSENNSSRSSDPTPEESLSPEEYSLPDQKSPLPEVQTSDQPSVLPLSLETTFPLPDVRMSAPKVPSLSACGQFDGSEAASRWIDQLHWQFEEAGWELENLPASKVIRAINMLAKGDVATYLDSDTIIHDIVERASSGSATGEDLKTLEQRLIARYPAKPVDAAVLETDDLTRIAQRDDEPLSQYYNRIQSAFRQAGGRDRPRTGRGDLIPVEVTFLKNIVSRFVDGLQDFRLKQEALTNRARSSDALWQCYEIIQDCQQIIKDREQGARRHQARQRPSQKTAGDCERQTGGRGRCQGRAG